MSKTGKVIRTGKRSNLTQALPDHPIYKRGWTVGESRLTPSSNDTKALHPDPEIDKFLRETLPAEMRDQMSAPSRSEQTDGSSSSTGATDQASPQSTQPSPAGVSEVSRKG
ncbi:MAG: hypothetical protein KQH59_20425 [Desulfobulbaceae bacterium]|nr:hypothetical protein [Desulfobulbaceae bacterium]